jgi:hypothetical protein
LAVFAALGVAACNGSATVGELSAPLQASRPAAPPTPFAKVTLQSGWQNAPFGTRNVGVFFDPNSGIVHFSGAVANGNNPYMFTLDPEYRPDQNTYVPVDLCNAHNGRLLIQPNGDVSVENDTVITDAFCFTSLEGASYAPTSAGFSALTLQNGWQPIPSNSFALFGTLAGAVRFKGAIGFGATPVAFTLPVGFRPSTSVYIHADLCNSFNGRVIIQPNGVLTVQDEQDAPNDWDQADCFTSLDGVWFLPNGNSVTPLTLQNGWTDAPFATAQAGIVNINGIAHFRGAVHHVTTASSQGVDLITTLPSAFAPTANVYLPVDLCNAFKGRLLIKPNGQVVVSTLNGNFANAECFTSLDGVSYSIAGFAQ